jgi:hypothetical protein
MWIKRERCCATPTGSVPYRLSSEKGLSGELGKLPGGVLNAPSLLTEIHDKVSSHAEGDEKHVINFTLLPQTEQALAFHADRLGEGAVTMLSRACGNYRITSTGTRNLWWVQYSNAQYRNIQKTLQVTGVPSVACTAPEGIPGSAWCMPCVESVAIHGRFDACPECGSRQLQVSGGEAMQIKEPEAE